MPRKKNRRKELPAKRRAEAAKAKPRAAIVAHHHPSGAALARLAAAVARHVQSK